jgi:bifunctional non-homologous end joining protein LigD
VRKPTSTFIEPQLLTSVDQAPQGDEWLHEVKHDGYGTLLLVEGKQARAQTRTGLDGTNRYPGIVRAAANLDCRSAIMDGEVVVQDARGVFDFDALRSAIKWQPHRLIFYAFDLLHLDGKDQGGCSPSSQRECGILLARSISAMRR